MRPKKLIGFVLMLGFGALLFLNFGSQVGGYMGFAEAEASGAKAHVVGTWVEDAPTTYDTASNQFTFQMRDENGVVRTVYYNNPKPANFEEAEQLVIEGYPGENGFVADHILVKCPSKYNEQRGLGGEHPTQNAATPSSQTATP